MSLVGAGWRPFGNPNSLRVTRHAFDRRRLVVAHLKLAAVSNLHPVAGAVLLVGAVVGGFAALAPVLEPSGNLNLLIFFVLLVGVMVLAAVPIAFAFGLATVGYLTITTSEPVKVVVGRMDEPDFQAATGPTTNGKLSDVLLPNCLRPFSDVATNDVSR